jgi:2',3'-cyclic-nucleotide 2'-phosphodiesterase (5'-nucleotidase family)
MRKLTLVAALAAALLVAIGALSGAASGRPDAGAKKPGEGTVDIQLVTISDWHGQLPSMTDIDFVAGGNQAGAGAAVLKGYIDQARAANPNTLVVMAGDSWGATPPHSAFFNDTPAVTAMNMMGVDADTFGNHNFDRGISHLQSQIDLADFPFVAANLKGLEENLDGVTKRQFFSIDGVRVALIGIVNEEAPTLTAPGSLGTLQISDSVEAANKAARQARSAGAQVVVILTHKGLRTATEGELTEFADAVDPSLIDVIVGDHTNIPYNAVHQGRIRVVENLSKGVQFTKVQLTVNRATGVTSTSATQHLALTSGTTPDPALSAYVAELTAAIAPTLSIVLGHSTVEIPHSDACFVGGSADLSRDSRRCESKLGNVVADALRATYDTDFALTNSGGLRAPLSCPLAGASGFCPTSGTTAPFPITRGSVLGVLPFGNFSVTMTRTGAELKAMLNRGASAAPARDGRYAQVSGLCFTYDIQLPMASRVVSAVRQAADGSCTGAAVDLTAGSSYTVATNDFTAGGGDGYPNFTGSFNSLGVTLDADVANYIQANSPLTPTIQGRSVCIDSDLALAPACPAINPSAP